MTCLHGVLLNIHGKGLLLIGEAGVGKSSLALELLQQGHQLIADDMVEIRHTANGLVGHCPAILHGLLHVRELGVLNVQQQFGSQAVRDQSPLTAVVKLHHQHQDSVQLNTLQEHITLCDHDLPLLHLSLTNPASPTTRLMVWLDLLEGKNNGQQLLIERQQQQLC